MITNGSYISSPTSLTLDLGVFSRYQRKLIVIPNISVLLEHAKAVVGMGIGIILEVELGTIWRLRGPQAL